MEEITGTMFASWLIITFIMVMFVIIYCILIGCCIRKAESFGRNRFFWFLVAMIYTPFLAVLLLHCLGESRKLH